MSHIVGLQGGGGGGGGEGEGGGEGTQGTLVSTDLQ